MPSLTAVLFDLDGTLIDSERDNVESVVLAMRRLGREMTDEEQAFVIGHSWRDIYAMLVRNHGIDTPMERLIDMAVDEKQALIAAHGFQLLPGAAELVERLAARVPLAIASGASRREVHEAAHGTNLARFFKVMLGAEDYPRGKPDPAAYLAAMAGLGVVATGCVVIEDATPGILAGRAAGARVIGVRAGNYAGFDLTPADLVVDSLRDVTDPVLENLVSMR